MKTLARPSDLAEIQRRLKRLGPESRRRWGRMSVDQMVCHLGDCFRMLVGEKPAVRTAGPVRATLVRLFALYVPMRWPAGIRTSPELDQEQGGTTPGELALEIHLAAGAVLFGRRSYEILGGYWPTVGDDDPMAAPLVRLQNRASWSSASSN